MGLMCNFLFIRMKRWRSSTIDRASDLQFTGCWFK